MPDARGADKRAPAGRAPSGALRAGARVARAPAARISRAMAIEVRLPELAESMSAATLTAWLKEVGDHVTAGEPIAEVETDKTTVELEAPATGVIEAIQVSAGTADVAVGAVLALLREGDAGQSPRTRVNTAPRSPRRLPT